MKKKQMVLSAVGPDKPGLVAQVSKLIHDGGANLEDSRMAVLAGDFALLVLFSGSEEALAAVRRRAEFLEREFGLQMGFKEATPRAQRERHRVYEIDLAGVDQPGIVHRVSSIVAGFDANVLSLESGLSEAAFQGTPVFHLHALVELPMSGDPSQITARLEKVAEDLGMNLQITPAEDS